MQRVAPYRLLVVRLGAMGDILHALPAITALRQMHPLWRIDWVVEPRWRSLLSSQNPASLRTDGQFEDTRTAARPIVDGIVEADTRQWRKGGIGLDAVRAVARLRAALRAVEYDAVLDLQGAIRSAIIARFPGCRRIIGDRNPRERQARWLYTEPVAAEAEHVIDRACELASAIAADPLRICAPQLPVDPLAEAWCDSLLQQPSPFVLIHPGAGWGAKRWPAERYRAVADWLAQQGMRVFVNVGPGEETLAQSVMTGSPLVQAVQSNLAQLIALTRRAALVIGGDTGPLHLACATGRPVVGIYGPTDPARNGPYRFPSGAACSVLRTPERRRDHRRLPDPEQGLLRIDVEMVRAEAERLLAQRYNQQE